MAASAFSTLSLYPSGFVLFNSLINASAWATSFTLDSPSMAKGIDFCSTPPYGKRTFIFLVFIMVSRRPLKFTVMSTEPSSATSNEWSVRTR